MPLQTITRRSMAALGVAAPTGGPGSQAMSCSPACNPAERFDLVGAPSAFVQLDITARRRVCRPAGSAPSLQGGLLLRWPRSLCCKLSRNLQIACRVPERRPGRWPARRRAPPPLAGGRASQVGAAAAARIDQHDSRPSGRCRLRRPPAACCRPAFSLAAEVGEPYTDPFKIFELIHPLGETQSCLCIVFPSVAQRPETAVPCPCTSSHPLPLPVCPRPRQLWRRAQGAHPVQRRHRGGEDHPSG